MTYWLMWPRHPRRTLTQRRKDLKLTNIDAWHVYAGGCGAPSDSHSYSAHTSIGEYNIWPHGQKDNCENLLGYQALFCNNKGLLPGGLWITLEKPTTLPKARQLCQDHLAKHNGTINENQIPGSAH